MPIKPENRARYPKDWPAIRDAILLRAGNACEHPGCGARQYDVGWWKFVNGTPRWFEKVRGLPTYGQARVAAAHAWWELGYEGPKPIVIVLTIAHLDHTPENCAPANLRCMCQRHHLAHDIDRHRSTAYATRKAANAAADLFASAGTQEAAR